MQGIRLADVFAGITEQSTPKTVATVNSHDVGLAKVHGEFIRRQPADTDEFFMVIAGRLTIRLEDREVVLDPGDAYVVPAGTRHRPFAPHETWIMMFESGGEVACADGSAAGASGEAVRVGR